MKKLLRRLLDVTLVPLVGLVLVFEEWGWVPLARAMAWLARRPLWARLEAFIGRLPPVFALATFALPAIALLPVKLLALYWIGRGQAMLGLAVVIAAKIAGTALVARLFTLTQPALMRLAWFARWYPRWKAWKDALIDRVHASAPWQAARAMKARARAAIGRLRAAWRTSGR